MVQICLGGGGWGVFTQQLWNAGDLHNERKEGNGDVCVYTEYVYVCGIHVWVHIYRTYVHDYKRHMYIYFSQSIMGGTVCGLLKDHANY